MRVTILNGDPEPDSAFQAYLQAFAARLRDTGCEVEALDLRLLDLKGCSGCWGCWVKTPGTCVKRDDSARVAQAILAADLVVAASPLAMGFTSALLKGAMDQLIGLVHPYFLVEGGEVHHRPRYARYPNLAVLVAPGPETDAEDLDLTFALWRRLGRNLKFPSTHTAVADRPARELADALTAAA